MLRRRFFATTFKRQSARSLSSGNGKEYTPPPENLKPPPGAPRHVRAVRGSRARVIVLVGRLKTPPHADAPSPKRSRRATVESLEPPNRRRASPALVGTQSPAGAAEVFEVSEMSPPSRIRPMRDT